MKKQNHNSGFLSTALVILIAVVVIVLASIGGALLYVKKSEPEPEPGPISGVLTAEKRLIKLDDIVLEKADVTPQIPQYNLPLSAGNISNWEKFSEKIQLSSRAKSLLEKNGFVVVPTPESISKSPDDFVDFYATLKNKDLPIFITADSLLHYYHIFFDTTLMKLERDLFYQDVWEMSKDFFDDAVQQYNSTSGDLKEAAKRNIAYISVALESLKPKKNQVMSDETLREEYCTSGMSADLCEMMIEGVKQNYGEKASFKYFSDSEFKKYSFDIPDLVKDLVEKEIEYIEEHEEWRFSPIFIYKEDYTQYVPRGHYTKSEKLKNYFKALMWYGRMTALIRDWEELPKGKSLRKVQEEGWIVSAENGFLSTYDAKIQTLQASLISKKFLESEGIQQRWQRMYAITSFFVGFSDDLGPYEYSAVLKSLFEQGITSQEIEEKYSDIKNSLSNLPYNPKIYSGLDAVQLVMPCPPLSDKDIQALKVQAGKILENTKGFRLMGQRFTIDSWLFSEIVSPYSGEYNGPDLPLPEKAKTEPFTFAWDDDYPEFRKNRPFSWVHTMPTGCPEGREVKGFPRGLDVMALFGSERAKEILENSKDTSYSDYEKKFSELKKGIDALPADAWFQNLYWNWLYVLKSLLGEWKEGYQTFMQTKAWQDKELNTVLASWAELRHDTILYVKQSYTMAELGGGAPSLPIVGYVEPVPEFYARLLTLTKMTNKGLKGLVPQEELEKLKIEAALDRFADILSRLLEISKKELENKSLTKDEYDFIEHFGSHSENLIKFVSGGDVDPKILKTVMIADVHTEGNIEKALEEGVGYIKTLVVAYKLPEGHILVGVGPVFSYYEFKQPMKERLTDEVWREMLDTVHPPEPEWTKSFSE